MVERPDLLARDKGRLTRVERWQIATIRRSFEPGRVDRALRWCQRTLGASWIHRVTSNLFSEHGIHLLPEFRADESYILVANHRSFFDLYVVTSQLVRRGLPNRIVFPVRSEFFYDRPLGFVVNGAMSFFAMYPPIFRERERAALNLLGMDELAWLIEQGGCFVGIHPEGKRNLGDDPYALLPAQSGVGRLIHKTSAKVIPVFVNGLSNDLKRQILGNFDGKGDPVHAVFGAPLDFEAERRQRGSPRLYQALADATLRAIAELGEEERRVRAALLGDAGPR